MTIEEAIGCLSKVESVALDKEFKQALQVAIQTLSSKEPQGLDEAAEKAGWEWACENKLDPYSMGQAYYEGYKAGVKWRDAQITKLPDNIDEAAFEYACGSPFRNTETAAFKAGAKWMAEQGVTFEASIDELSCGYYNLCVQSGLTSEDDTIVQIRKRRV